MVTLIDVLNGVWNWLGVNSGVLASLAALFGIFLTVYVARKSPKWQFETQYKITTIKQIFPKLSSNINDTIIYYNGFLTSIRGEFGKFDYLLELINSGEVEYIKKIDETLYDNLYIINNEIMPLMQELTTENRELMSTLQDKWSVFLRTLDSINLNINGFVSQLYSDMHHDMWVNDYSRFLEVCHRILDEYTVQSNSIVRPTDDQLLELQKIAEDEIKHVRRNVDEINSKINDIIKEIVIPKLRKYIADPL